MNDTKEQEKTKNWEDGIMDILKGIRKILGVDDIKNTVEVLNETVEVLNEKIKKLTDELHQKSSHTELSSLQSVVKQLQEKADSTQGELQSLYIRENKDYTAAIEHFIKMNDEIGHYFKKYDILRYALFDLLVYNSQDANMKIENFNDQSYPKDKLELVYNYRKQIVDFHKSQVKIINEQISYSQTLLDEKRTYQDSIIYPQEDDNFNKMLHDNLIGRESCGKILKTIRLGYSFPNFKERKASVLLKFEENV